MLGLFKKRKWQPTVLGQLQGSFHGLVVSLWNFPCNVDENTGKLAYSYPDFGVEFLEEFHAKVGDFKQVQEILNSHQKIMASIALRDYPPIQAELSGVSPTSKGQYYSDVADAIIAAFESKSLKP